MKCTRCGSEDIRIYRHDVVNVGSDVIGGEYAACRDCGLHYDVQEVRDDDSDEFWEWQAEQDNMSDSWNPTIE